MTTPPRGDDRALVLTYGPSGSGKTSDAGYSFPNALFLAAPGALHSIKSLCGYQPRVHQANTIDDATKVLMSLDPKKHKVDSVVVDDFSFLAEQQFAVYDKRYSGFRLWGALRDSAIAFRNAARYAKCHVILNCWEKGPHVKPDGTRVRGGPMLSGKLPEQIPAMCDMVLRCGFDQGRRPWPGVYRCSLSTDYVMKDRFDVAPTLDPAPMNIAEILRAAGFDVSRHPGMPWQEEVVEMLAQRMVPAEDLAEAANAGYTELLQQGVQAPEARWTVRDAMDRAVIRRALSARDSTFIR